MVISLKMYLMRAMHELLQKSQCKANVWGSMIEIDQFAKKHLLFLNRDLNSQSNFEQRENRREQIVSY